MTDSGTDDDQCKSPHTVTQESSLVTKPFSMELTLNFEVFRNRNFSYNKGSGKEFLPFVFPSFFPSLLFLL